ncbi:carboxyl-terminal processing protease [Mucilaginibacter gracilis]|uniref:Carboxyl-terminal processing protease n=1 Tax=Mucilaginibacter gracilis TaxID=423350 RepID=A0A495IYB6_9SPHI|nr:S41 family peptidase [Mucilaginibacter gracilis]RKR81552.1 carboxyl-terminal processing protease [Mucilaginibacter gracilis]
MNNTLLNILRTLILLLVGAIIGIYLNNYLIRGHSFYFNNDNKLASVVRLVHNRYVDSVNIDSLEGETVNQFLQNLDPHSVYLQPQRAQSVNQKLSGGFDGVGIEYQLLNDTLFVTQVYPGGPAAKAGIRGGDRIVTLNGEKFAGTHLTTEGIHRVFTGPKDSELQLGLLHNNTAKLINYTLKRGHVELSSLDAAYMVAPQTGYIKISKFAATTDRDFKKALAQLKTEGMTGLTLDLRNNGGGYLSAATAMADEFLPAGKLIMYTKGRHEPRTDYFSTDSGAFEKGKVAIMIDEYSASASEILAGAMQDLDRATIVGRRSFGKGLVQEQFGFNDGSAINLTVARYYTPSGRSIQKSYKGGIENYHNELAARMQKGELFSAKNNMDDSLFKTPAKYHTANGRKVYSGGGIMPDVFVPADTMSNTRLLYDLNDKQLFMGYVLQKMQPKLAQYPNYEAFASNYRVTDDELTNFIVYATKTLKQLDSEEIKRSRAGICLQLKAMAARFKWGDVAYFKTLNHDDETLKAAIEAVK